MLGSAKNFDLNQFDSSKRYNRRACNRRRCERIRTGIRSDVMRGVTATDAALMVNTVLMMKSVIGSRLIVLCERSDDLRGLHRAELDLETRLTARHHEADGHKRLRCQQGQQPEQTTLVETTAHWGD